MNKDLAAVLAVQAEPLDTGNFADDPLYKTLDALYERGWEDSGKRDYDPRGSAKALQPVDRLPRQDPLQPLSWVERVN